MHGLEVALEVDLELRLVGAQITAELNSLSVLNVEMAVEEILVAEAFPAARTEKSVAGGMESKMRFE